MSTKKRMTLDQVISEFDIEVSFASSLKAERESRELSRKDFGSILGLTVQSIYDLENGRRIPSPERAAKIASLLNLSIPYWVQLAIQDNLNKANLNLQVQVS